MENRLLVTVNLFNDSERVKKLIFRGPRCHTHVTQLAPATCYQFRLKGEGCDEWRLFRAATEASGPYSAALHMTRAVRLGKSSLIRKIALRR